MVYNGYTSVRLDEPLLIDGSKEMRVGVRIHDYDEWQWPICAAVADDYVPGKTDLYTYDDGKTWSRLSDLYDVADIQGHCIWDITAHVADEAGSDDMDFMEMPLFYNVYRDGVLLNRIAIDGNATSYKDMSAYDNASYQIMAHADDGSVSPLSEVFLLTPTIVMSVAGDSGSVIYDSSAGTVSAGDDAIAINVFDMSGASVRGSVGNMVSMGGLSSGAYIIRVDYAGGSETSRLIVR